MITKPLAAVFILFTFNLVATDQPTIDWISQASGPAVLSFVILGLIRGTIVTGREADALRKERDKALDLVYEQAKVTQQQAEITARALDVTERKR